MLDYRHYEEYQSQVDFSEGERNTFHDMMQEDADGGESVYRAKIVLLKDEGYCAVPETRAATNHIRAQENGYIGSINKHRRNSVKNTHAQTNQDI